jgi:hypothetical protein
VVRYGADLSFPVQLLGRHRTDDDTWHWAWAGAPRDVPSRLLTTAYALRSQGTALGVPALSASGFALNGLAGEHLAMVGRGLAFADAWCRVERPDGAWYVLAGGLPDRVTAPVRDARIAEVLGQVAARFDVAPRTMAQSFLAQQGFGLTETPGSIVARRGRDATITVTFDAGGRLARVRAARRPWWRPW